MDLQYFEWLSSYILECNEMTIYTKYNNHFVKADTMIEHYNHLEQIMAEQYLEKIEWNFKNNNPIFE